MCIFEPRGVHLIIIPRQRKKPEQLRSDLDFRSVLENECNFSKTIDKHRCVAYNIDECRWEVTNLDLNEKKIAMIFKAFCDENRIRILKLLTTGEKCACKLLEKSISHSL